MSMKTSYRYLDYAYGIAMQKLRNTIGLTQAGLADRLGVSSRTVAGWEAGSSYPRVGHPKELIVLAVQQQAFSVGHEAEEIRVLWKVAHQKIWLDERWLSALLAQRSSLHGATVETGLAPVPEPTPLAPVEKALGRTSVKSGSLNNNESYKEVNEAEAHKPSKADSLDENDHAQESHHSFVQTSSQTSADQPQRSPIVGVESAQDTGSAQRTIPTTGGRRKLLISILIALVILTIIGSAGALFLYATDRATTQANNAAGEQASKTTTDPAYPGYLSGHGTLAFFDSLSRENGSRWSAHDADYYGASCQFTGEAYHVGQQLTGYSASCPIGGRFSNFAFEVQLTITQGECGGISLNEDIKNLFFYYFSICQDGTYMIKKYVYYDSGSAQTRSSTSSFSAIRTGRSQQNKIALVASGSTMTFYVNEQQIDQVQESSNISGEIALIAVPFDLNGHTTDVAYSNARLWRL